MPRRHAPRTNATRVIEQLNQIGDRRLVFPVAGCDARVAHQAIPFDALYRRSAKHLLKSGVVQHEHVGQLRRHALQVQRQKGDLLRFPGKTLKWANILANIAAKDPVSEIAAQVAVDPTFVLDSVITDATARIQHKWGGKGISRAVIHAARAGAAHTFPMRLIILLKLK